MRGCYDHYLTLRLSQRCRTLSSVRRLSVCFPHLNRDISEEIRTIFAGEKETGGREPARPSLASGVSF